MNTHLRWLWGVVGGLLVLLAVVLWPRAPREHAQPNSRADRPAHQATPELRGTILAPLAPLPQPAQTTPPPVELELVTLVTMDLGTRLPAAHVAWAWDAGAGVPAREHTASGDAGGRVNVPAAFLGSLRVTAPDWVLLRHSVEELRATSRVWIAGRLRLSIHVQRESDADGELDPTTVSVFVVPLVPLAAAGGQAALPEPGSVPWMQTHGLTWEPDPARPDASGTAVVQSIRIPGLAVKAHAQGWMASVTALEMPHDPSETEQRVEVFMHRSPRLRGRILDERGLPVANCAVRAYTLRTVPSWAHFKQNYSSYLIPGAAMVGHTAKDGTAYVGYTFPAITDADGHYVLDVRDPGEVTLAVHAPGRGPSRSELGGLVADREHDVQLAAGSTSRVRITFQGRPYRGQVGTLSDVTNEHLQMPVDIATDAEGAVPGHWLESGRSYFFLFGPDERRGFIRWDERESVELTELERNYDRFYGYTK